ncbi:MAG: hypothetical protein ACXQS8_04060, partial [Candidatus Helarchaeales archaeon]
MSILFLPKLDALQEFKMHSLQASTIPESHFIRISNSTTGAFSPDIAIDSLGIVHVCWIDENGLHHALKKNDSFSSTDELVYEKRPSENNLYLSHARILIDEFNTVHLAVAIHDSENSTRSLVYFYKFSSNNTWFNKTITTGLIQAHWTKENFGFNVQENASYFSFLNNFGLSVTCNVVMINLTTDEIHESTIYSIDMFTFLQSGSHSETWTRSCLNGISVFYIKPSITGELKLTESMMAQNTTINETRDIMTISETTQLIDLHWMDDDKLYLAMAKSMDENEFNIKTWHETSGLDLFREIKDTRNQLKTLHARFVSNDEGDLHLIYPTWKITVLNTLLTGPYLTWLYFDRSKKLWISPRIFYFPSLEDPRNPRICIFNDALHLVWQDGDLWDAAEYQEGNQIYYSNSSYSLS